MLTGDGIGDTPVDDEAAKHDAAVAEDRLSERCRRSYGALCRRRSGGAIA
jgi:hypothetical protein